MRNEDISKIRKPLMVIAVILVMYVLNILSIIFIPLTFGLFFALLFTPALRWLKNRGVPLFIGIVFVFSVIVGVIFTGFKVVEITSIELRSVDKEFVHKIDEKLNELVKPIIKIMGIETKEGERELMALLNNERVIANLFSNVGSGLTFAKDFITTLLLSLFFMILFLAGSVKLKNVLEILVFKEKELSVDTFHQIEKGVFTFVSVKVFVSLLTGIVVGVTCYFFDVSFPTFWGLITFLLNFVQLIGSVFLVIVLSFFAFIELNATGSLLFFILIIVGIQLLIGSVIEPVLLGKSFSINTITILVMLSIWGVVWGIPGLVLSIPITAMLKIILEKTPSTKGFARLMS